MLKCIKKYQLTTVMIKTKQKYQKPIAKLISQNLDISKRVNERWQYYEGFTVNTL